MSEIRARYAMDRDFSGYFVTFAHIRIQDRLVKLIEIWISSKTFPADILIDFKNKLLNPTQPPRKKQFLLSIISFPKHLTINCRISTSFKPNAT
jgi:hypothetical protein